MVATRNQKRKDRPKETAGKDSVYSSDAVERNGDSSNGDREDSPPSTPIDDTSEQNEEPQSKRSRHVYSQSREVPTFREGAIIRCKLHNFMTYSDCEFEPGPGLNLVLGPNGTGKSSIVSAICVGLCGNPKLLGRAHKVKEYIKHGEKEAFVELELYRNPPQNNTIIRRTFKTTENYESRNKEVCTGEWRLNGKVVTQEKIKEIVKELNIQLDNLTQFLPQDRVAQFAAMNSVELLKSTQEAVLPPSVIKCHQRLIQLKQNLLSMKNGVEEIKKNLETLKKKNEILERDVEKFKQREKHMKRVEELNLKVPLVEFSYDQEVTKTLKQKKDELEKQLKKLEKQLYPFEKELQDLQKSMDVHRKNHESQRRMAQDISAKCTNIVEKMNTLSLQKEKIQSDLLQLLKREKDKTARKENLENEIKKLEQSYHSLLKEKDVEELKRKIKEKIKELNERENAYTEVKQKRNEIQLNLNLKKKEQDDITKSIHEQDNIKEKRVTELKNNKKTEDSYKAFMWSKENKSDFQGECYLLAREISVEDSLVACYIEYFSSKDILIGLVCENENDQRLLTKQLIGGMKLNVAIISGDTSNQGSSSKSLQHPCEKSVLEKIGLKCFLDEAFKSPEIIKRVLNENFHLYRIAIGDDNTNVEDVFKKSPIRFLCTTTSQYIFRNSKYNTSVTSTMVAPVAKNPKFLVGADRKQRDELLQQKSKISQDIKELEQKERELLKEEKTKLSMMEITKNEKRILEEEKKIIKKAGAKLKALENDLKHIESEEDIQIQEKKLNDNLRDIVINRANLAIDLNREWCLMLDKILQFDTYPLVKAAQQTREQELLGEVSEKNEQKNDLKKQIDQIHTNYVEKIKSLEETQKRVISAKEQFASKHKIKMEQVNRMLLALPDDLETLEEEIIKEKASADSIYTDPHVIKEYEKRQQEIEKKEKELTDFEKNFAELSNEISDLEIKWKEPLEECISSIDKTFQTFCKNIGISGEVKLQPNEDYAKYEVQIRVQFRHKEGLVRLDSNRQSGGERSVTTILYLLSLQQLNKCPFRVVDEINQGMDPNNERKIFLQMLESSKGENTPQSFLITPKLLSDLVPDHAKSITILFIYNGPYNLKQSDLDEFWKKNFLPV